jgi:hypothetical protein
MTTTSRVIVPLAALLGIAGAAGAADDKLATTLQGVVQENLRAYDAEDADGVLRTMHSRSPEYGRTKAALPDQFAAEDLTVQLVDFRYMGHDDEFAVARVKTKLTAPPGSDFDDNVVDSIMLFHREGGLWKLWSDDVIGVAFQPQGGTAAPSSPAQR